MQHSTNMFMNNYLVGIYNYDQEINLTFLCYENVHEDDQPKSPRMDHVNISQSLSQLQHCNTLGFPQEISYQSWWLIQFNTPQHAHLYPILLHMFTWTRTCKLGEDRSPRTISDWNIPTLEPHPHDVALKSCCQLITSTFFIGAFCFM